MLDCRSFGGQAGASARIENYLGFPTGISGLALMARAFNQAQKFGVEMAIPDEATSLEVSDNGLFGLTLQNGERANARSVVLAAVLRRIGLVAPDEPATVDAFAALERAPVLGHGQPVGSVVAVGI